MDLKIEAEMWRDTVLAILKDLWTEVALFAPNLVGALVIVLIGYFISKFIKFIVSAFLKKVRLDSASEKVGIKEALSKTGVTIEPSEIVGKIAFLDYNANVCHFGLRNFRVR